MRTNKILILAFLALGLAACAMEQGDLVQKGEEVRISTTIANLATRVAYGDEGATNFVNGDEILVVNTHSAEAADSENHAVFAYDGTNWMATSGKLLWEEETTNTFEAYYPATLDYTLPTDQSTPDKLAAADRMEAQAEADFDTEVQFKFEHMMAKVTFNTTLAAEFDVSNDKITSLKVVTNETSPQEVTACADGTRYTAIIIPYWYETTDDIFVKVYVNEEAEPLTVKVPADFVGEEGGGLLPGYHYTFNLTVGQDKVTIESVTMADIDCPFEGGWNTDIEEELK